MRIVLTTFGSEEDAARVVRILVEEKLAACGTMIPGARSIYTWEAAVHDEREVLVLLKTAAFEPLAARLGELHPYETPEIVALNPAEVSGKYLAWIEVACGA